MHLRNKIEFFANKSLILRAQESRSLQLPYIIIFSNLQFHDAISNSCISAHFKIRGKVQLWCVIQNLLDIIQAITPRLRIIVNIGTLKQLVDINGILLHHVHDTREKVGRHLCEKHAAIFDKSWQGVTPQMAELTMGLQDLQLKER